MTQSIAAPPAKFVGLAWSALILGIVGVVGSIIPLFNNLTAMAAVVGIILALIAVFGTRRILALLGGALCVLAIVFTVMAQNALGQSLSGHDPAAMSDVAATGCSVTNDYGTALSHATVTITNHSQATQSYMATISVNDTSGTRIGEINTSSNSLAAGQSATLSGTEASGTAVSNAKPGPATCVVAHVNRFAS
jgi:hypothetical protein